MHRRRLRALAGGCLAYVALLTGAAPVAAAAASGPGNDTALVSSEDGPFPFTMVNAGSITSSVTEHETASGAGAGTNLFITMTLSANWTETQTTDAMINGQLSLPVDHLSASGTMTSSVHGAQGDNLPPLNYDCSVLLGPAAISQGQGNFTNVLTSYTHQGPYLSADAQLPTAGIVAQQSASSVSPVSYAGCWQKDESIPAAFVLGQDVQQTPGFSLPSSDTYACKAKIEKGTSCSNSLDFSHTWPGTEALPQGPVTVTDQYVGKLSIDATLSVSGGGCPPPGSSSTSLAAYESQSDGTPSPSPLSCTVLHVFLNGKDLTTDHHVKVFPGQAVQLVARFFPPDYPHPTATGGQPPQNDTAEWKGIEVALEQVGTGSDKIGRVCPADKVCAVAKYSVDADTADRSQPEGQITPARAHLLLQANVGPLYFLNTSQRKLTLQVSATPPSGGDQKMVDVSAEIPPASSSLKVGACQLGIITFAENFKKGAFNEPIGGLVGTPDGSAQYPPPAFGLGFSSDCNQGKNMEFLGVEGIGSPRFGLRFSGHTAFPQGRIALLELWDPAVGTSLPPTAPFSLDNGFPFFATSLPTDLDAQDSPGGHLSDNADVGTTIHARYRYSVYLMYLPTQTSAGKSVWVALNQLNFSFSGSFQCTAAAAFGHAGHRARGRWVVKDPSDLRPQMNGTNFYGEPEWSQIKSNGGGSAHFDKSPPWVDACAIAPVDQGVTRA